MVAGGPAEAVVDIVMVGCYQFAIKVMVRRCKSERVRIGSGPGTGNGEVETKRLSAPEWWSPNGSEQATEGIGCATVQASAMNDLFTCRRW